MKQDGIRALKFEAAQIHFLSDVFVDIATKTSLKRHYNNIVVVIILQCEK